MGKILTSADYAEQEADVAPGELTDDMAVTVASWWHSPSTVDRPITALSHGLPFNATDLANAVDQNLHQARRAGQNEVADLDQLAALGRWARGLYVTAVWSSYGHRFLTDDGEEVCLTCGAHYRVIHDDPDDYRHGAYVADNGDSPNECTGDTSMSHGEDDEHKIDAHPDGGTCAHCDHDCNCLVCTG